MPKRTRLGELLLQHGLTQEQLNRALRLQEETGERLGQAVVKLGYMTASRMADLLSEHLGVPRVDWDKVTVTPELVMLLPESILKEGQVCPIKLEGRTLTLAMVDPYDVVTIDEIRRSTGYDIEARLATADEIEVAINRALNLDIAASRVIGEVRAEETEELQDSEEEWDVVNSPGVKIVDLVLSRAIQNRASDIHVEPREDFLRIRFRIDGVLRDVMKVPRHLQSEVLTRLKVMADMDITERKRPQDGRLRITIASQTVDMRISSLPTIYGEKIVVRIFNQAASLLNLKDIGFLPDAYARVKQMLRQPQGLILVTGPTGSGKTTTLYSFLNELNVPEKNIITIEDPVEYRLEGINQVQVNSHVGLSFASGLRTVLRQDPDIVMVGEMRDQETAEIGIRAALTGHLVLSTLHTNSAVATITRLIDMGVEPALIAATLIGVVAQRLVRTICPECKEPVPLTDPIERHFLGERGRGDIVLYRGQGCPACTQTGYRGRIAVEEVFLVTREMRKLIYESASEETLRRSAVQSGMRTLKESGIEKILAGKTTVAEVMRTVYGLDDLDVNQAFAK